MPYIARDEQVGRRGRAGDVRPRPLPLVRVRRRRAAGPGALRAGQRLTRTRGSRERGSCGVGRWARGRKRVGASGRRATGVGSRNGAGQRMACVARDDLIGAGRRAGNVRAIALPLVGVGRRRAAGPGALRTGQLLADGCGSAERRCFGICRSDRRLHDLRDRGLRLAIGRDPVRRRHDHPQAVVLVRSLRRVGGGGGAGDALAARRPGCCSAATGRCARLSAYRSTCRSWQ